MPNKYKNHYEIYEEIKKLEKEYIHLKENNEIPKGLFKRVYVATHLGISEGTVTNIKNEYDKEHIVNADEDNFQKEKQIVCSEKIIPLLKDLGYSSNDFIEDKALQMGNVNNETSNKYRPDFRLLDNWEYVGEYLNTAPIIIEAKFIGETDKNMKNAVQQAVTYARRLCSPYIVIATQFNITLYQSKNNYITRETERIYTWSELFEYGNKFNELKNKIGREHFTLHGKEHYYRKK